MAIENCKRETEMLRDSERQWREIFEHSPVMYFLVDAGGKILSVNTFGATQLGYSVNELTGQSFQSVCLQDDRLAVEKSLATCLEKPGQSHDWEIRKVRKDGTRLWVHGNAKAVRRADHQLILLVAGEDISERKRTEEALRLNEAYMAHAQRLTSVGSWAYRPSGAKLESPLVDVMICEHWSAEMYRIFGADPQKGFLENDEILQRIHPDDRGRAFEAYVQLFKHNQVLNLQYRYMHPDGRLRVIRKYGNSVFENGVLVRWVGACLDFTDQEQKTEKLRRSEACLTQAQRISHIGSFTWNTATGEIYWSDETFRIFGLDPPTIPTLETIVNRTHPDDRLLVERFLDGVSQEGRDWEIEHRLLMPDGSVKYLRAAAYSVKDTKGDLEFVGGVMDISAMRRAEEALYQSRAELARVSRVTVLGELTAAIAHEVSQPLTGLVSSGHASLRWLAAKPPNLRAARHAVERMIKDGIRAGEVLHRVRALVTKSPSQRDWLDINDAILEIIALIRTELQRNRISLQTNLAEDLPRILADRIQFQQVILNLMMNAIEAMSEITPAQRELSVASLKDGASGIVIAVRDSGPGLDPAAGAHVFDAFYTTKPDGMGMGLAISRSIVEAHGGTLAAASGSPQGALFQIWLPIGDEDVQTNALAQAAETQVQVHRP